MSGAGHGYGALVRRTTAALIAALPLAGFAGCGGDSGSRLSDALDAVSSGPAGQRYFAWTDTAAINDQADALPSGMLSDAGLDRWMTPLSVGVQPLAARRDALRETFTFDVFDGDQATMLGLGEEGLALRLDDVVAGPYASAIGKRDAERSEVGGHTVDVLSADAEDDELRLTEGIRDVLAGSDTIAVATDHAALTDVLGEGDASLGSRRGYAAAADCLGDVVSATISPATSQGLTNAALIATGTRGGDSPTDVLCVVGSEQQADAAAAALRDGLDPDAGEGFTAVDVDTGGSGDDHFARAVVTVPEIGPLGTMTKALADGHVRDWLAA